MNTVYRVVWNPTTNAWVVVSELTKGRKKKGPACANGAAVLALVAAVGGMGVTSEAAAGYANSGGVDVCAAGSYTGWDYTGAYGAYQGNFGCNGYASATIGVLDGSGVTRASLTISGYDNSADLGARGTLSLRSTTQRVTVFGSGGIELQSTTSLMNNRITNLQAGSAGTDAVNVNQLNAKFQEAITNVTDPNAVHYDAGTSSGKVSLTGIGGTTIANVKDGSLAATSKDAVNGGQLFTTNENVTNLTNNYNTLNTTVTGLRDNALLWDGTSAYTAKHAGTDARIKNLAAGAVSDISTEAINGSQLHATADSVATALGGGSTVTDGKISSPTYTIDGAPKTGVQSAIEALDARITNIPGTDALKWDANVAGGAAYSANHGTPGVASRITNVANATQDSDAVNKAQLDKAVEGVSPVLKYIRFGAVPAADDGVATASGNRSTAIGAKSFASGKDSFAMGFGARATADGAVAIGAGSFASKADTFAVGSFGKERRIVNVGVAVDDTDAATWGQVKALVDEKFGPAVQGASALRASGTLRNVQAVANASSNEVTAEASNVSKYQSTNATANATAAQQSLVGAQSATDVAAAAFVVVEQVTAGAAIEVGKNLDGTAVNFQGTAGDRTLAGVAAGKADDEAINVGQLKAAGVMNAQGEVNSVVAYDSASRSSVTLGGQGAAPVALRNVAAGSAETDAVNVAQLNQRLGETRDSAVREANAYTDRQLGDVWAGLGDISGKLSRQDRRISDVGAMATAHAQMVSNAATASLRGDNGAWAVGLGHEESRNAVSVGYAKSIGEKAQISFGASFSGEDQSIGLGFGRAL